MSKAMFREDQWRFFPGQVFSMLLFLCVLFSFPVDAIFTRKLDQTDVELQLAPPMDTEMKCGVCPCSNPCSEEVTPPPPPTPLSPPPTQTCRPPAAVAQKAPPPPRFIYVTGSVPGESSESDSNSNNWIYYYSEGAERPEVFLGLTLWGSLSLVLTITMVYL